MRYLTQQTVVLPYRVINQDDTSANPEDQMLGKLRRHSVQRSGGKLPALGLERSQPVGTFEGGWEGCLAAVKSA